MGVPSGIHRSADSAVPRSSGTTRIRSQTPCHAPKHTYIHRNVPSEEFASEVERLKRELAHLQQELRTADATGNRRGAIDILARMLKLQSEFFERWRVPSSVPPPP
jgi:hypothetical protein